MVKCNCQINVNRCFEQAEWSPCINQRLQSITENAFAVVIHEKFREGLQHGLTGAGANGNFHLFLIFERVDGCESIQNGIIYRRQRTLSYSLLQRSWAKVPNSYGQQSFPFWVTKTVSLLIFIIYWLLQTGVQDHQIMGKGSTSRKTSAKQEVGNDRVTC